MAEIKCPNCNQVFQVDESGYAQIVQQIRDTEFEKEIERRLADIEARIKQEGENERLKLEYEQKDALNSKDSELAEKDAEIKELKGRISNFENDKKLAIKEIELAKTTELAAKDNEITDLKNKLENKDLEISLRTNELTTQYEERLKGKDEEIAFYKDFKARQSTKMVGESLEQHCSIEFEKIRMTAFPNAFFDKDNDAKDGTKGDFIFRDFEDGEEYLSIMFEMKNEMDDTDAKQKHTNESFLKKLDEDRTKKNCEYAILVSLLEIDNELYNSGIVDVSYKYPKMYVIRPQFFIPMITLLKNAAMNSLNYRKELAIVKNQQNDLQNFEKEMNEFKDYFGKKYELASKKFVGAIEDIDKTIKLLEKIKDELRGSENNLRLANNKAQDLSIKKLTKDAPSVRALFNELNSGDNKD